MNLSMGIDALNKAGFEVVIGDSVKYAARRWHLSAPDEVRARNIAEGFRRNDIDAIWCVRGGAGAMRILDAIPYEVARENPKPIIGYSDITVLQKRALREDRPREHTRGHGRGDPHAR